jgi:glycine/D-amino acid oxidase-like deaminating enzyme
MAQFSPFEDTLWFATAPAGPPVPPLTTTVQADVCIVGGGYTGLTTAIVLARSGRRVVVLERKEPGFGGSGRNAGHCTPTFTHHSLEELHKMLGAPWADRLIQRQIRANRHVTQLIRDYKIACEWVQNGYVMGALRPGQLPSLKAKVASYNAAGARTRMLDRQEMAAMTGSPRFFGGWFHEEAGHLNPLAYARGLARAVIQEGGAIYGDTPVTDCQPSGQQWHLKTLHGSVLAKKVIFATGAYTVGGWPKLDRSFRIMKVFVAATQPLSDERAATVLPHNTTMHDGRGDIFVYKRDAFGRIVASMFPIGRRGADPDFTRKVLTDRLRWLHPQLGEGLRWEFLWFGELDMQYRVVPRLYGLAPGVVALTGLSGRGVPTGTMLGGILSDWAKGMPEPDLDLRVEPLHRAPLWMAVAPRLKLRQMRLSDNIATCISGAPLPPHA